MGIFYLISVTFPTIIIILTLADIKMWILVIFWIVWGASATFVADKFNDMNEKIKELERKVYENIYRIH